MNPEIVKCPCGNASATYKVIGEDLWWLELVNSRIEHEGYADVVYCNSCGEDYDEFDPYMVKVF